MKYRKWLFCLLEAFWVSESLPNQDNWQEVAPGLQETFLRPLRATLDPGDYHLSRKCPLQDQVDPCLRSSPGFKAATQTTRSTGHIYHDIPKSTWELISPQYFILSEASSPSQLRLHQMKLRRPLMQSGCPVFIIISFPTQEILKAHNRLWKIQFCPKSHSLTCWKLLKCFPS